MKHEFTIDKDNHSYICKIKSRNRTFIGVAECREEDWDFETEATGKEIAYTRAMIAEQQDWLRILRYQEQAVYHVVNIYDRHSLKYNPHSIEVKMAQKQLRAIRNQIKETKALIKMAHESLTFLIKQKDMMYRKVRALREREENRVDG